MCNYPLELTKNGKTFTVPCNRCLGCRIARRQEWQRRIIDEKYAHKAPATFVTFTYSDDHLPFPDGHDVPTLKKEHGKLLIKRLRERLYRSRTDGTRPYLTYFLVGEYGDTFKRPHMHAILLGIDSYYHADLLKDIWPFGYIKADVMTRGRIRYVVDYIEKQEYLGSKAAEHYYPLEPPFSLKSKGLGLAFLEQNADTIRKYGYFRDGKSQPLPRYYEEKLGIYNATGQDHYTENKQAQEAGYFSFAHRRVQAGIARETELLSKLNLKGKI